jgi:hypothetical protein
MTLSSAEDGVRLDISEPPQSIAGSKVCISTAERQIAVSVSVLSSLGGDWRRDSGDREYRSR